MHNKDLVGKEVVSSDAWTVGTIRQIVVDRDSWQVTAFEVLLGDEGETKGVAKVTGKLGSVTDKVTDKLGVGPVTEKIGMGQANDDDKKDRISITLDQVQGVDNKVMLKIPKKDLPTPVA